LLFVVPTVAHLLFSGLGFNPSDDGFTLAYSRRILEGQAPHRDFIIIRPFVSPLLHVPFVAFGGPYTFWLSRWFVWCELAWIAFLWVVILNRLLDRPFPSRQRFLAVLIAFAASAHSFPIIAWHTIDGLLFVSLGLWLAGHENARKKIPGYALIGMGYLCKQNFALFVPLVLAILGDWRNVRCWLAAALPGLAYFGFVLAAGAAADAVVQLSSQADLLSSGVIAYLDKGRFLGALAAVGFLSLVLRPPGKRSVITGTGLRRQLGLAGLYLVPVVGVAICLAVGYLFKASFVLFWWLAGVVGFAFLPGTTAAPRARKAFLLVLAGAWCVSISEGYNTPVLLAGPLIVALLAAESIIPGLSFSLPKKLLLMLPIAALIVAGFVVGRYTHIYREQTAGNLTHDLGEVLSGGKLIRTNPYTWTLLDELGQLARDIRKSGKTPAILPGVAAYWVKSDFLNPLPVDWALNIELDRDTLVRRVTGILEQNRGKIVVIVQKISDRLLPDGFIYNNDLDLNRVIAWVREHFSKVHETSLHEVYE